MNTFWVKIRSNILAVIFGAILALISLEICMQIASYLITSRQEALSAIQPEDERKIRILALGESTTAELWQGEREMAWPGQLQEMLNNSPELKATFDKQFKVYNRGMGGTNTNLILKALPGYIKTLKPHIVISMVGINNNSLHYFLNDRSTFIENLKTYNLYLWLKDSFSSVKNKVQPSVKDRRLIQRTCFSNSISDNIDSYLANVKKLRKDFIHIEWEVLQQCGQAMFGEALQLAVSEGKTANYNRLMEIGSQFSAESLIMNPTNKVCTEDIIYYGIHYKGLNWIKPFIRLALENQDKPSLPTVTALSNMGNDFGMENELKKWKLMTYDKSPYQAYINDYREIVRQLTKSGSLVFIMSYPTLSTEIFKNVFSKKPVIPQFFSELFYKKLDVSQPLADYQDLKYISNENFLHLVKENEKKEYFKDMFAMGIGGKFGHTTVKGHQLIAKNVYEQIHQNAQWIKSQLIGK